jgi:hypothetical protein
MSSSDARAPRPDKSRDYVLESEAGFDVLFGGVAEHLPDAAPLAMYEPPAPVSEVVTALVQACRRRRHQQRQRR